MAGVKRGWRASAGEGNCQPGPGQSLGRFTTEDDGCWTSFWCALAYSQSYIPLNPIDVLVMPKVFFMERRSTHTVRWVWFLHKWTKILTWALSHLIILRPGSTPGQSQMEGWRAGGQRAEGKGQIFLAPIIVSPAPHKPGWLLLLSLTCFFFPWSQQLEVKL